MREGLLRERTISYGCQNGGHISIAETPEIAACFGNVRHASERARLPSRSLHTN
jgi:hypothetical protein